MDMNDLFDGIAEAFWQYQAETAGQVQTSANPTPTGLGRKQKLRKRRRNWLQRSALNKIFRKGSDC